MKYRDLIQFEPIEGVIQLREADDYHKAEQLVTSFVISDRMADALNHRILLSLQLDQPGEGGGLFVVGNYGTGKSHLMSVISAVSEHAELAARLTHPAAAQAFQAIAGKFKVVRQETGSTNMSLRDVVFYYLEHALKQMGVIYRFPSLDETPNSKDPLVAMMAAFHERYPDHGLLVVIDELLDYLRGRTDLQLVHDLNFLREVGEICNQTQLRFIAGLQESLFGSAHFQFAADSIQRVKARFEQVRIAREDVAYVVSRRLLAKTQAQRGKIRQHLQRFTKLYDSMAERLEDFVELFPVHPAYLEVFEQVTLIEKRQVLKALSYEMQARLDDDVPADQPGLISFDAYWELIKEDKSYTAIPEVREVLEKSRVLEDRVNSVMATSLYQPAALRMIHALALHRLSTGELRVPIGLTPKELRDKLCLSIPIPEPDAEFLLTSVESALAEVSKAVSGQFISHNRDNDQYYLDLDKNIDFDTLIAQRADVLDRTAIDRYYFEMLVRALELTDSSYVPGFRIWEREIPWTGQGITRRGYIFLGAPNERSTAQPERDFYIHFLSLYSGNGVSTEGKPDEVFFYLAQRDRAFDAALKSYGGAREMSTISTGFNKQQYEAKADIYLRTMVNWLRENLVHALDIHHRSETLKPAVVLAQARASIRDLSLRDQVFRLSSAVLDQHFRQKYADYPCFVTVEFTKDTITQGADAALRAVAGGPITRPAQSVLEALRLALVEGNRLNFTLEDSPYARHWRAELQAQPVGKVLNRGSLVRGGSGAEQDMRFGLELEWLVVVLMAMVRQGEVTLNLPGRKVDSDDLENAAKLGVAELIKFTSIGRPKSLPEQALRALFAGLNLPEGLIADASQHENAIAQLYGAVEREVDQVTRALEWLREGLRYWGESILTGADSETWRSQLTAYKEFLDSLQHLTTPGRLRNFATEAGEVRRQLRARNVLNLLSNLHETLAAMQPHFDYIYHGVMTLPGQHPWQAEADALKLKQLGALRDSQQRQSAALRAQLNNELTSLRQSYAQAYLELHNRARLNSVQETRKKRLTSDARWTQLKGLAALDFLPVRDLHNLEKNLDEVKSCAGLGMSDLKIRTVCALCGFDARIAYEREQQPAMQQLERIEADFDQLYQRWITALKANLSSEGVQRNVADLDKKDRSAIETFLSSGELPDKITERFLNALRDALHGLEKVALDGPALLLALSRPGLPCTSEEFEARFRNFLSEYLKGKDPTKVRIQLDW